MSRMFMPSASVKIAPESGPANSQLSGGSCLVTAGSGHYAVYDIAGYFVQRPIQIDIRIWCAVISADAASEDCLFLGQNHLGITFLNIRGIGDSCQFIYHSFELCIVLGPVIFSE